MVNKILNNNLFKRIFTALILIPIVIYVVIEGGFLFDSFLGLIFIISAYEVITIVNNDKKISLLKKLMWIVPILIYIVISIIALRFIKVDDSANGLRIMVLFLTIWVFDTFAYFTGSLIGGPKLCSKISPKKTWSGLVGGCFFVFIFFSLIIYYTLGELYSYNIKVIYESLYAGSIAVVIGLAGQIGDLFESWFKRKFDVKDSGNLLPGHGGVLDRMDSIFLASILFYLLLRFA